MAHDLIFSSPSQIAGPWNLSFGIGAGNALPANISLAASLASLTLTATAGISIAVQFSASLTGIGFSAACVYDNAAIQAPSGYGATAWQDGVLRQGQDAAGWRDSARLPAPVAQPWQDADSRRGAVSIPLADLTRKPLQAAISWQDGQGRAGAGMAPWKQLTRNPLARAAGWQDGQALRAIVAQPWQDRWRRPRPLIAADWQDAAGIGIRLTTRSGIARPAGCLDSTRWQSGKHPAPGIWKPSGPIVPPITPPYYVPPAGSLADLVFRDKWSGAPWDLIFRKPVSGRQPIIIPKLRAYIVTHTIDLVRLPDLEPVPCFSATVSTDADSGFWTLSASCPASVLAMLPGTTTQPSRVRLTLDGVAWDFLVEQQRRGRRFGQATLEIGGRSTTALIADPYWQQGSFGSTETKTAQQLAVAALDLTGVSLDWALTDWLVPAGVWSHLGTPFSAVARIAEAAGAMLQSAKSDPTLRLLPRYAVAPWGWADATPDFVLPLAPILQDSFERRDAPGYNAVYVSGESQGVLGYIKKSGTAGDKPAPMVTDALATASELVRQRGTAILGAAGHQAIITLELPLLPDSGVIDVGKLVEVQDPAGTWRGLVRGTRINATQPSVRQALTLERHLS
jgi:hypothetical protein